MTTSAPAAIPQAVLDLAAVLGVMSNPPRLMAVLLLLERGTLTVTDLCTALGLSPPALSHQLKLLKYQGVARSKPRGHFVDYSLTPDGRALAGILKSCLPKEAATPEEPEVTP